MTLFSLSLALWCALASISAGGGDGPFLLGGIQVNEPDHGAWVAALESAAMNTVEVTVYAHQGDWDSANLWWDEEEPWVLQEIRAAKSQGLKVVLVLRVALDHAFERNRFLWHGMIQPQTEADLEEWFRRYSRFALEWARIAAAEGVDVLAVASEMNALTNTVEIDELPVLEEYWLNAEKVARERERLFRHAAEIEARHLTPRGHDAYPELARYLDDKNAAHVGWARQTAWSDEADSLARVNRRRQLLARHWRRLIGRVGEAFPGPLTYAANFDQYQFVDFWDDLDLIGINAYFPLRRRLLPPMGEAELAPLLEARWTSLLRSIDEFREKRGVPAHRVLFTEIGYVRRANSTLEPWAAGGFSVLPSPAGERLVVWQDQAPDAAERALAIRALYDAHLDLGGDLLAGLLYWKLTTDPYHLGLEPFALALRGEERPDPMLAEMRRFGEELDRDRWRHRARAAARAVWGEPVKRPPATISATPAG